MDKVKVTSGFGIRMHPVKKVKMMQKGIDLAAPEDTEVYATVDRKVINVAFMPQGSGRLILISMMIYSRLFFPAQLGSR